VAFSFSSAAFGLTNFSVYTFLGILTSSTGAYGALVLYCFFSITSITFLLRETKTLALSAQALLKALRGLPVTVIYFEFVDNTSNNKY